MHLSKNLIVFSTLLFTASVFAGEKEASYKIEWLPVYEKKISPETSFRSLNFTGASFDENFNPHFDITQPLSGFASEIKAELKNVITEPLTDISLVRNIASVGSEFSITTRVVTQKKKPIASFSYWKY